MADEGERKRRFSFVASQTGCRIQQHIELCPGWQFAVFSGDAARDFVQLLTHGQVVFQHDEKSFQLYGYHAYGR